MFGIRPHQQQQQRAQHNPRANMPPPAPRLAPLGAAAAIASQRVVWAPRSPPNPFKRSFSPLALLIFVAFLAAAGYYFYIRIARTLNMGSHTW
jgi:hypothetical protein